MKKIVLYYQTFNDLSNLIEDYKKFKSINSTIVTDIVLASIHFGLDNNNEPYIHLNDKIPTDPCFDILWTDLTTLYDLGVKIHLLIGGAGGACSRR